MSLSVTSTLPSCTSLGCTNWMDSSMPFCCRRMAHTKPSKSLRVRSLYFAECSLMNECSSGLFRSYRPDEPHCLGRDLLEQKRRKLVKIVAPVQPCMPACRFGEYGVEAVLFQEFNGSLRIG